MYTTNGNKLEKLIEAMNLKHHLQHGMMNLNYLMGFILLQVFKLTLNVPSKNVNMLYRYMYRINQRITFKIKAGYILVQFNFRNN